MRQLVTLFLSLGASAALAQTPITITQTQFPAATVLVNRYQEASLTGVTGPQLGANQAWDYLSLQAQGPVSVITYAAVGANPPFAGSVRSSSYTYGPLAVPLTGYEGFTADGFSGLGSVLATTQTYSLTPITGGASDAIVYPAQNIPENSLLAPVPLTSTTRVARTSRFVITALLTLQAAGLSQVPFISVTRITDVDSVAGWGTLRIPVAGSPAGSAPIPVLLDRRREVLQDSFYLGGQPAPAALLAGLGLTQGAIARDYRIRFFRQNSPRSVLNLGFTNATFSVVADAQYSAETTIPLGTQAAREIAGGGLLAWPNPAGAGQPLGFALSTVAPGRPLRLTLRDATGRPVAELTATNGQPTSLPTLPAGLYLAEAEAPDGTRASRRIVLE